MFFNERPLYDALETSVSKAGLEPRDTAFARAIVMMVLRRLGEIDAILATFLREPLAVRSGPAELILRIACAELTFLDVPAHAAVSSAVSMAERDHRSKHFKGLINAVSRRIASEGKAIAAGLDAEKLNMPTWTWEACTHAYGEAQTRAIAAMHMSEPSLDITVLEDPQIWVEKLDAKILPTGSLRRATGGRVEALPGYAEGKWLIQDAAAALPARLLGNVKGKTVIDLCAAPGGKTAQLAAAGAMVTAVDLDFNRMKRVMANLSRLTLKAEFEVADALEWRPKKPAAAVLLDAPCTATGTVRRHPDVLWRKDLSDVMSQADLQLRLLTAASAMVESGGTLLYCVCSLAREEGEDVLEAFLQKATNFARRPIQASEISGQAQFLTSLGDLRTLPCHWPELGGLDGFFAARLRRTA